MNASLAEDKGPIFVVGSPRSGTSVLTWCIGQHPNIQPQEESGWIGSLAVDLAICYRMGTAHGERSQLSALGLTRDQFLETFGRGIDTMVLGQREAQAALSNASARRNSAQIDGAFKLARSRADCKSRWVDGTPEYSMQICALKKLFPTAKFVHIARDVDSVVDSMLHFKHGGHVGLVNSEQAAYEYWLRTASACVLAESALGSDSILRVRYDDLIGDSERTLRRILAFLGESFDSDCVQPLSSRINSSNVPPMPRVADPATSPSLVEQARQLSEYLQTSEQVQKPSASHLKAFEATFMERVAYVADLDNDYHLQMMKATLLTNRLNRVGLILILCFIVAVANKVVCMHSDTWESGLDDLAWIVTAMAGLGAYVTMRWRGVHARLHKRKRIDVSVFP